MVVPSDYLSSLTSGAILGFVSWFPVGPGGRAVTSLLEALAPDYSSYVVPAYLGIVFSLIFHLRDWIARAVQGVLTGRSGSEVRYFLYASAFTVLVGYPIIRGLETVLNPGSSDLLNAAVGAVLVITGVFGGRVMSLLAGVEDRLREDPDEPTFLDSLISGLLQGLSFVGDVSRSGLVLLGLSGTGIDVERALELSFLIAPTYLVMKLVSLGRWEPGLGVTLLFAAFLSSFAVSLLTIRLLLRGARALGRGFLVPYGSVAIVFYLMGVMM